MSNSRLPAHYRGSLTQKSSKTFVFAGQKIVRSWSPFIQMGKTEPVQLKTKGGWLPWAVGGGLGMLLIGGLAISRRKREV